MLQAYGLVIAINTVIRLKKEFIYPFLSFAKSAKTQYFNREQSPAPPKK